jgi:hypothetical protein
MDIDQQKHLVSEFYAGLATADLDRFLAALCDDAIFNVAGKSPISGRFQGKEFLLNTVLPQVLGELEMETFEFAKKWKIMCADGTRVVAFMEADGMAKSGIRYNQRYCQTFEFRDGKIGGVWEFFDDCLAAQALFGNSLAIPEAEPAQAFEF